MGLALIPRGVRPLLFAIWMAPSGNRPIITRTLIHGAGGLNRAKALYARHVLG